MDEEGTNGEFDSADTRYKLKEMRVTISNIGVFVGLFIIVALVSVGPHWVLREGIMAATLLTSTVAVMLWPDERRRLFLPALIAHDVILTALLVMYAVGIRPDM